jgi:hypothetical protein
MAAGWVQLAGHAGLDIPSSIRHGSIAGANPVSPNLRNFIQRTV